MGLAHGEIANFSSNVTATQVYVNVAFNAVIIGFSIPSNFIIVLLFWRFKRLRDMNNTAITMLCAVNFVRECVVHPVMLFNQLTHIREGSNFHENPVMCHVTAVISTFSCVFCPLVLALIAYVRYNAIVPGKSCLGKLTTKKFNIISVVLLLVATVFSFLPYMEVGEYGYSESHGICFVDWRCENDAFRILLYTVIFAVAFPVLTISYARLFIALRKHNRKFKERYAPDSTANINSDTMTSVIECHLSVFDEKAEKTQGMMEAAQRRSFDATSVNEEHAKCKEDESTISHTDQPPESDKKREIAVITKSEQVSKASERKILTKRESNLVKNLTRQEYRVTTLLILIFISYCICWFPVALVNVLSLAHAQVPMISFYVAVTMVELNSALDPMIYGLGNRNYRQAFMMLSKSRKNI